MNEYTTGAIIGIGFVAAANGLLVFTCTVAVMVVTGLFVHYLPQMAAWNRQRRVWKSKAAFEEILSWDSEIEKKYNLRVAANTAWSKWPKDGAA